MKYIIAVSTLAFVALTGQAHAGCDFFIANKTGPRVALQAGECAVLVPDGDGKGAASCEGLKVKTIPDAIKFNDNITSVMVNHQSTAILKRNRDNSNATAADIFLTKKHTSELGGMNKQATVLLCKK
ncbi:MAG: hypothetical protein QM645_05175 [Asticcacaulis sp.]